MNSKKFKLKAEISGRTKNLVSIYKKMKNTNRPFEQIYDIIAVRAIVKDIADCYHVLSIAQHNFKSIQDEFDDYIQNPKLNGYQSLHMLLEDSDKHQFELQIRTEDMHRTSEFGVAAHWRYKARSAGGDTDSYFSWLREKSMNPEAESDHHEVEKYFHLDTLDKEIFVLTPGGDLKKLPKGATPIDFAFAIHRDVGIKCNGAKVNGQMVSFDTELKNGDKVEVMTANQPKVNQGWAKFAKSNRAAAEIRRWLRKEMKIHSIKLGEELLMKYMRKQKVSWVNKNIKKLQDEVKADTFEDLFAVAGSGKISAQGLVKKLFGEVEKQTEKKESYVEKAAKRKKKSPQGISVGGMENLMVNFGKCCLPIPGDPIHGYITRGKGITVHRETCKNVHQLKIQPEREVKVEWESETEMKFAAGIKMHLKDSENFSNHLNTIFGKGKVELINYKLFKTSGTDYCIIVLEISDTKELDSIMKTFAKLKTVIQVTRMQYSEFKKLLSTPSVSLGKKIGK